jgi:hypothetical protein
MSGSRISPVSLGLALGLLWGLSVFGVGLLAYLYSYGQPFVTAVGNVYVGYVPSLKGSALGGILAFLNAFVTGFLIALFYNMFNRCCGGCNK